MPQLITPLRSLPSSLQSSNTPLSLKHSQQTTLSTGPSRHSSSHHRFTHALYSTLSLSYAASCSPPISKVTAFSCLRLRPHPAPHDGHASPFFLSFFSPGPKKKAQRHSLTHSQATASQATASQKATATSPPLSLSTSTTISRQDSREEGLPTTH